MAFEEGAGVQEIQFGVGFGGGEGLEGFVEQGDDALLLRKWWDGDLSLIHRAHRDVHHCCACPLILFNLLGVPLKEIEQELLVDLRAVVDYFPDVVVVD